MCKIFLDLLKIKTLKKSILNTVKCYFCNKILGFSSIEFEFIDYFKVTVPRNFCRNKLN